MRERSLSFKDAVNLAIRRGLGSEPTTPPYRTPVRNLGVPKVDLTKALRVAGDLEDEQLISMMVDGK